jgi:transcriptional regulator with XRE-family HTH domain
MLKDIAGDDAAISAAEFDKYTAERTLVTDLVIFRSARGLSQEDIAEKLGRTQSWVSKFEHSTDDALRIRDLRAYMSALGLEFRPGAIKQGATLVDEIKLLSFAIRQKLIKLAESTKDGDGLVGHVAKFFCSAFHNINRFLNDAAAQLPLGPDKKPYISIVTMVEEMDSLEEQEEEEESFLTKHRENLRLSKEAALN